MKHYVKLLALLSVLILTATSTLAIAEEDSAHLSGSMEVGVSGVDTKDNPARVNEYSKYRSQDGTNLAPTLDLDFTTRDFDLGIKSITMGPRDQKHSLELDYSRIFRLDVEYQVFEHWKDHDNLGHIGATMFGDIHGEQPRVTSDATVGQITKPTLADGNYDTINAANSRYNQELKNNYIITHREWENEAELVLPDLPNVTFHAGYRSEEREGMEQSRSLSKCNQCHVQANGKDIDEKTEDKTIGFTGKFGLFTIDYEYLSRDFKDKSTDPSYSYLSSGSTHAGIPDTSTLLYKGDLAYGQAPDSEKISHTFKARVDVDKDSSVTASYVKADIESKKYTDSSFSLDRSSLKSNFKSFFLRGSTRIAGVRLSLRGGTYKIDGPSYTLNFPDLIGANIDPAIRDTTTGDVHYESAESRKVTEVGIDGVYRLMPGTTLRLGYEYENIDRDMDELGDTKTNTIDVAVNSRINKQFSGRISYKYQDIDEALAGAHTGIGQVTGSTDPLYPGLATYNTADFLTDPGNGGSGPDLGSGVYYWNSAYPNRELETSMSPEKVNEVKLSATWAPTANVAATAFARFRNEKNDSSNYKQNTYIPGASIYYAPNEKVNLTMAYTFNKMETENQMCVGWYHG